MFSNLEARETLCPVYGSGKKSFGRSSNIGKFPEKLPGKSGVSFIKNFIKMSGGTF